VCDERTLMEHSKALEHGGVTRGSRLPPRRACVMPGASVLPVASGHASRGGGAVPRRGRGVRVDPIKPMFKAPGTEGSKLKYDELLSKFAFKFNLRRYTSVPVGVALVVPPAPAPAPAAVAAAAAVAAGAYTRPLCSST